MTLKYELARDLFLRLRNTKNDRVKLALRLAGVPSKPGRRVRRLSSSSMAMTVEELSKIVENERVLRAYARLLTK